VAGCFEKAEKVSMKDFVNAFGDLLTREQIKRLIYKMERDELIIADKLGRWTIYQLSKKIDNSRNILTQFQLHIEG
jgi:hypothetical protein